MVNRKVVLAAFVVVALSGLLIGRPEVVYAEHTATLSAWQNFFSFSSLTDTLARILREISGRRQQALLTGAGSGLIASWSFDEGSGTSASDGSGNGYSGTLTNGVLWTASGQTNGAVSLDGVDDFVTSRSVPNLSAVTLSFWVKVPSIAVTKRLFDRDAVNPIVRVLSGGRVQFIGNISLNSVGSITTNTWHHIVATGDASGHKLYINGSLSNSNAIPYTISQTARVAIGGSLDRIQGDIDEVRIYDRALSASEVGELYSNAPSAPSDPTPNPDPTPTQNQAPNVSAGPNQTITLPNSVSLSGTVTDDGLPTGSRLTQSWSKVSGIGTVTFTSATQAVTTASFSLAGTYVLRLTGSDGTLSSSADVTITVTSVTTPPTSQAGTYYVDFDSGNDANDGRSTVTPWKHAPGDPNAAGTARSVVLIPGNTVLLKGGVIYRGSIYVPASGSVSSPIIYKGDGWGTGKAIIDGSASITSAWTRCLSAADCGGNPNYANIYYTQAPVGYTSFERGLFQDSGFLWYAQDPNPIEPFYYDSKDINTYRIIPLGSATLKVTRTSITDPRYFTQLDSNFWNDAYAAVWREGNFVSVRKVRSYTPFTNTITFDDVGENIYTTFDTQYAILNNLNVLDRAGEYVYSEATRRLYLWPHTSDNPTNHIISYPSLSLGVMVNNKSNVIIEGMIVRYFNGGLYIEGTPSNITFRNNDVTFLKSPTGNDYAINLKGNNILVEGNTVTNAQRNVGILAGGGGSNIVVKNNYVYRTSRQGIWFMGVTNSQIIGNTVDDIRGTHANGISAYLANTNILIANNKISRAQNALTVHGNDDPTYTFVNNITLFNNLVDGQADSWGHYLNGLTVVNNTFAGGFNVGASDRNVTIVNNIINGGGPRATDVKFNNLYTALAWWQNPTQYGWTLGSGEQIETDLSKIYVNAPGKDFHLKTTGPAANTGINALSYLPTSLFPSFNFSTDLDGRSRTQGSSIDIGAYESGSLILRSTTTATTTPPIIPTNIAPTASAGSNQTITLPSGATLSGTAVDDGLPSGVLTLTWSKVSGPGTVSFSAASSASTNATFSTAGTYVLRFSASDGALSASADVTIIVNAAPIILVPVNRAPAVSAGSNQTITLPSSVSINGSASDDGLPRGTLTISWTKVSGPGTVTFTQTNRATTSASFSTAGTYVLRISGSDSALSASADVTITVNAAPLPPTPLPTNRAPSVSVGASQTITLPTVTVSVSGTAVDDGLPSGSTLSRVWSKASGPGTVTFSAVNSANTNATFSTAGTYVLRLSASDGALSASADVTITVNAAPSIPTDLAPTVLAGDNQTLVVSDRATLRGTASANTGSPLSLVWTKVSGPGTVTFTTPTAAETTASFSEAGDYILRLSASDGTLTSSSDVVVVVNTPAAPPISRVVAGGGGGGGGGGGSSSGTRSNVTLLRSGAAPTLTTSSATLSRVLVPGISHSDVVILKNFLVSQSLLSATAPRTNLYDVTTQRAVEAFQKKYAIVNSGTPRTTGFGAVGPKTRTKINGLITAPRPLSTVTTGSSSPELRTLLLRIIMLLLQQRGSL